MSKGTSRRAVLTAGAAAAGTALVTGCGNGGGGADETRPATSERPEPPEKPERPGDSPAEESPGEESPGEESPGDGEALATTAEIPVGGGKIFESEKVVVTQPEEGTFRAFSAVCTHQGCTVSSVEGGTINCACHGSKYRVADAAVANGPSRRPLPPRQITVESGSIRLA